MAELFMRSCVSARSVKDAVIVVATQPYFSEWNPQECRRYWAHFVAVFTPNTVSIITLILCFSLPHMPWLMHSLWLQCILLLFALHTAGARHEPRHHPACLFDVTADEFWLFSFTEFMTYCSRVIKPVGGNMWLIHMSNGIYWNICFERDFANSFNK